jgi:hypothetical protein
MKKIIHLIYFSTIVVILNSCSSSITEKPAGSCFHNIDPNYTDNQITLYFHEKTVKIKYWNKSPFSNLGSVKSEETLDYTYNPQTKTGNINGEEFSFSYSNTNKKYLSLKYNGLYFSYDVSLSDYHKDRTE